MLSDPRKWCCRVGRSCLRREGLWHRIHAGFEGPWWRPEEWVRVRAVLIDSVSPPLCCPPSAQRQTRCPIARRRAWSPRRPRPGQRWTRTLLCPRSARACLQAPSPARCGSSASSRGPVPGPAARPPAPVGRCLSPVPPAGSAWSGLGPGRGGLPLQVLARGSSLPRPPAPPVGPAWHGPQCPLRPGMTSSPQQ